MDAIFDSVFTYTVIFLALQYFFSSRNSIYWGAILPIAYTVFMTWGYSTHRIDSFLKYIILLFVGLLFLIIEWKNGRSHIREKQNKELDKMKTQDIK